MSRQEIVEGYLDGQLSRRVFIRRLVATGVTAAVAINYAGLLDAEPAMAAVADYYLAATDNAFVQSPRRLAQGQGVEVHNLGTSGHNARDTTGLGLFNTGEMNHYATRGIAPFPGAGTYTYRCDEAHQPRMTGVFTVPILVTPPGGPLGTTFGVRWAQAPAPAGFVFDVQRLAPGQANYTTWRSGVRGASANFRPASRGRYRFRARVRTSSNNKVSGWSPVKLIQVT